MPDILIFLVHLSKAQQAVIRAAGLKVFPRAQFVAAPTVADAVGRAELGRRQLLIFVGQDETEIAQAAHAVDHDGLPRWAVLNLGLHSSDLVECLPIEECHSLLFGKMLRSVVFQHELLWENLRLRGDLMTVARRISHDLMSPLNCISISCELLNEMQGEATFVEKQIAAIRNSLSEATRTIDRVSFMLKASANPVPASTVSMDAVLDQALRQLEGRIRRENVEIQRSGSWPESKGVAAWLEVVWCNLITNALKHRLSSTPVKLGWNQAGAMQRFWVLNEGPPRPSYLETKLFRPFDQLHASPAPGLGLSLVQRLVSLQQGTCGYERLDGDSSLFYFTLPAADKKT